MRTTCLITLFAAAACGSDTPATPADASALDASTVVDAGPSQDATPQLGWVDFAVTGCASGDGSEASPCIGASPLVLRFTALAPAAIESQAWAFGDGSEPDLRLSPEHVFATPGSYDVTLNVDGPGGSAGVTRLAAIVVIPAPLGANCSEDQHCASGDCACDAQSPCTAPLAEGMCSLACDNHSVCGGNRCVNLDPTAIASEDWQRTTCLPGCTPGGGECHANSSCEALLGVDGLVTFACFPGGVLRPIGSSCKDFEGNLQPSLCATGQCLDLGDRGMCSLDCESLACPQGTACATFASGTPSTPHCVADCAAFACNADAQLSCQAPGSDFDVDETASPEGYCTPGSI